MSPLINPVSLRLGGVRSWGVKWSYMEKYGTAGEDIVVIEGIKSYINSLEFRFIFSHVIIKRGIDGELNAEVYYYDDELEYRLGRTFGRIKRKYRMISFYWKYKKRHKIWLEGRSWRLLRSMTKVRKVWSSRWIFFKKAVSEMMLRKTRSKIMWYVPRYMGVILSWMLRRRVSIKMYKVTNKNLTSMALVGYIGRRLKEHYKFFRIVETINRFFVKKAKNVKGIMIECSGRLSRVQRGRTYRRRIGKMQLNTLDEFIDYYSGIVVLKYSVCGIKVWVCRGKEEREKRRK